MHPDEEHIQRLLHGELAPAAETAVREHLAVCVLCRERVSAAEQEDAAVDAALHLVDHAPPRVDAERVAARARAERFGWGRWAAGILLAVGAAGAAYAAPGSPLARWVEAIVARIGGTSELSTPSTPSTPPTPPPPSSPGERVPGESGIAVDPGRNLVILFSPPRPNAPQGQLRVSLSDGMEVVVRSLGGAASFTSEDVDRLVVRVDGSPATFEVQVPRDAPRVEIRVGEHRLFLKDGPSVTTEAPADAGGLYLLPLTASGS